MIVQLCSLRYSCGYGPWVVNRVSSRAFLYGVLEYQCAVSCWHMGKGLSRQSHRPLLSVDLRDLRCPAAILCCQYTCFHGPVLKDWGSVLNQILRNFVIPLRNFVHNDEPNPFAFQCCSIGSWAFCSCCCYLCYTIARQFVHHCTAMDHHN